ncbi:MAG: energy-coupling factor ABC transporter ATP-binding protein [Promethearchaeota archaeon]
MENYSQILVYDINYTYENGTNALKGIDFKISKGELVGIMGKNAAGKTTLIRTLNGLLKPQGGIIYIGKENTKNKTIATLSKKIGIVFQNPAHQLFSNTVEEELRFSLKNLNLTNEEIQNKIELILKQFNLEKYRNRSPLNLSGGEMKKLAIASIICRDPEILIFDEPTLGQDKKEIEFFINLLKNEQEKGKTIIIITHNIEFALKYIPRTILMADGKILADGPTKKILDNKLLIKRASLVRPQIFKFKSELKKLGIDCPDYIYNEKELANFLKKILIKKEKVKISE